MCARHAFVGASLLVCVECGDVGPAGEVGAWLVDFGRVEAVEAGGRVRHKGRWTPANAEDGLLDSLAALAKVVEGLDVGAGPYTSTASSSSSAAEGAPAAKRVPFRRS